LSNTIHPTALVSAKASLGEHNQIGAGVSIEAGVTLGNNNTLMQGVVLKEGTRVGNDNTLHEYSVLGGLPQDLGFKDKPTYVELGNGNVLREYVTVNRASQEETATRLGNDNYLMTQVHLGHDCVLANNVIIAPGTGLGGFVNVADKAFISGGVMVHQFVHIGTYAMVGGNAKITQNVLPYMITDGVPAVARGLNLVGLKRGGFRHNDIKILKSAYQLINRSGLPQETVIEHLREFNHELSTHLAEFMLSSKRSFHREKS